MHCSVVDLFPALHVLARTVGLRATAAEEGHELEHYVDSVLGRDVKERSGLVAERRSAAGEVGEGTDGDEGDSMLVRHEGHGGALHLHGGAPEVGADELPVAGVVGVDVGAATPGHPCHPGRTGQARRRVHARRQLQPLQLSGQLVVALADGHPERVLPLLRRSGDREDLLRLVPHAVQRVRRQLRVGQADSVVGEVEEAVLPRVVAGDLERHPVLRPVAVPLPVPQGEVRPGLGDGHVADLEVLVGVAGDAPVHDAFHPEQAQQQLGSEPCIQLQCTPHIHKISGLF